MEHKQFQPNHFGYNFELISDTFCCKVLTLMAAVKGSCRCEEYSIEGN